MSRELHTVGEWMNEWGFKDLCAYNYAYLSHSFSMSGKHTCQHQQPEEKHQCCEKLFGSLVLVMGLILKPWRSEHSNIWNVGFWKACLKGFCHNHIQDESSDPFCSLKCRCFSRNVPRATVDLQQIYTNWKLQYLSISNLAEAFVRSSSQEVVVVFRGQMWDAVWGCRG